MSNEKSNHDRWPTGQDAALVLLPGSEWATADGRIIEVITFRTLGEAGHGEWLLDYQNKTPQDADRNKLALFGTMGRDHWGKLEPVGSKQGPVPFASELLEKASVDSDKALELVNDYERLLWEARVILTNGSKNSDVELELLQRWLNEVNRLLPARMEAAHD